MSPAFPSFAILRPDVFHRAEGSPERCFGRSGALSMTISGHSWNTEYELCAAVLQPLGARSSLNLRMRAARPIVILLAGMVLLLPVLDGFSCAWMDQQTMECCGSVPSAPGNDSQDCCKTMVSSHNPSVRPPARTSLAAPLLAIAQHSAALEVALIVPMQPLADRAPQNSPPDLYTLHLSLLI